MKSEVTKPRGVASALVAGIGRRVLTWSNRHSSERESSLRPLTPRFDADQHQTYLNFLNAALDESDVRNVALTGRYGTGKSSVLGEFARIHEGRVLSLSISTLGPEKKGEPRTNLESDAIGESRTNLIEKELVKQLLHREKPSKLPQSRYQRIDRLTRVRAVLEVALGLSAVTVLLWLFDWLPRVPGLGESTPLVVRAVAGFLVAAYFVGAIAWVRMAIHNRLEVSHVAAAGASITLSKQNQTYFDQYLDEIVYFFESKPRIDIVLFEDLDRFDEPGIFEELRELNGLLNNSKQLTAASVGRPERTIRFVYAMRDSIFEQLGQDSRMAGDDAADIESVRANRTKFFDLVIPMVPFITHRTARELLAKSLEDESLAKVPEVTSELVDLAARYIPDMRLLLNIRNEYFVFAQRLISDRLGMENLSPDHLFALIVYKNLHLEDFELMVLGRSRLDAVYRSSREIIAQNLRRLRLELKDATDELTLKRTIRGNSEEWGAKLDWFFQKVAGGAPDGKLTRYFIEGTEHPVEASATPEFWREAAESEGGVLAEIRNTYGSLQVALSAEEVRSQIREDLRTTSLSELSEESLRKRREKIEEEIKWVRSAGFADLAGRPDLAADRDGESVSFDLILGKELQSELARVLVEEGHIDRYYNLYIAQYYGDRVAPNAMSFIVQNVDTNTMDYNYAFAGPSEIEALIREAGRTFLAEECALNIDILDHLLGKPDPGFRSILDRFQNALTDDERQFLHAYLESGVHAQKAVSYLASRWVSIFEELIIEADLSDESRVLLVDTALAGSSERVDYDLNEEVRDYLQDRHQLFGTIAGSRDQDQEPSVTAVENAVGVLVRAGVQCDDLSEMREEAISELVRSNCYKITSTNLRAALGKIDNLSLDEIRSVDPGVYEYMLSHPSQYLATVVGEPGNASDGHESTEWTIADPAQFGEIVSDLAKLKFSEAVGLIDHSNPDGRIDDLSDVPPAIWEELAECHRFPPTLKNVYLFLGYIGEVDERLADILGDSDGILGDSSGIPWESTELEWLNDEDSDEDPRKATENAKVRVAEAVLNAAEWIPDPGVRTALVDSLGLDEFLPVSSVPVEQGSLLGDLLERGICADTKETFAHFVGEDWSTLRYGIQRSSQFSEFVSPDLLDTERVTQLLTDDQISIKTRRALLKRFDEFVPESDVAALRAAGDASLATGFRLDKSRLIRIFQATQDGSLAIKIVDKFDDQLTDDEVLEILVSAGEPYSHLTTLGSELTFARDEHHESVFNRLRKSGRVESRAYARSRWKPARIVVKVR